MLCRSRSRDDCPAFTANETAEHDEAEEDLKKVEAMDSTLPVASTQGTREVHDGLLLSYQQVE